MTSLPQKWLGYTIPIRRIENLNTFTLEEVYEILQNYEFESKGFVDTSATKHVGASLIALVVDSVFSTPTVQSSCSKCSGCHFAKESQAPKTSDNFKANSGSSSQSTTSATKPPALESYKTTNGGEGYNWIAHLEEIVGPVGPWSSTAEG
ncbi:hypothetical protein L1987_60244 [Smallanthus sonchifolius]|uniref:Uncharacterized protein n=1 Tax=Smallanthus sonchifolius TaxID=185202 RepID=A0ACB9D7Y0_9ASTR|nr:hypothetical protein L1987_60244 [Smallanthus sonchifolius]